MLIIEPPVIGHRGASAKAPENTIAAFALAKEQGLSWIEFDVCFSKDGIPVVFHDKYLKRITGNELRPCDYLFAELQQMDAGSWFDPAFAAQCIISLEQAMQFMQIVGLSANIEIKQMQKTELKYLPELLDLVNRYYPQPNLSILFSSFSLRVLKCIRSINSDAYLGLLMHDWRHNWHDLAREYQCCSIHTAEKLLNKQRVKEIKDKGFLVLAYTVNSTKRASELFAWGVDAIFSDNPHVLHKN